ncbi:MAG: hypothetical protein AAF222_07325 [Pseudomonadota bacterium]
MARVLDLVSPRGIMRLLVLSYFIAVSLGWIGGHGLIEFMLPYLPSTLAMWLMQGLVLGLALLILFGIGRRHAALVLSLVVFFSSYTALYTGGDISAFWRDLALIGALLMTADFAAPSATEDTVATDIDESPRTRAPSPSRPHGGPAHPQGDQPFREDFDIARAG